MVFTRAQRRAQKHPDSAEQENSSIAKIDPVVAVTTEDPSIEDIAEDKDESSPEEESDASSNENDSSDQEDSIDESSEDESSDDEDLDTLLNKAQKALAEERLEDKEEVKLDTEEDKQEEFKLPKMDSQITFDDELYIRRSGQISRLVDGTVDLVENDEDKKSRKHKKTVEAIKEREKEEKERLSRKERQEEREKTAGKGWFDMGRPDMTPELKRDLQLLKMRHVIDRKRHYKKMGKGDNPKYFQVGTVIEGPTEYHSARMTRKERKQTIVDELMANEEAKQYYKRKFNEGQVRGNNGRKKAKRQMKRL
ncbi:Fcf2 pre-rRNA processing-domain-containing protein [Fennellomyces sp. T-0311]|nr:Fcf2 pre-rRNA processing-domain-containing protein [Fennellomyces sp. T-0311]